MLRTVGFDGMREGPTDTVEIRGRYGRYKTTLEKAAAYFDFIASPDGREWFDDVAWENWQWEHNLKELRSK